jgi:predicted phosphodiesterase
MLILICGDSHLTGRNPIARKDDLVTLQFKKWIEIRDLANKYNAPIIHTGDIFNTAVVANSLLTQLGGILSYLKKPLYFVWGNHDLQYHSYEMWRRTSLGVLWSNNDKVRHISEWDLDDNRWDWIDWNQQQEHVPTNSTLLLSHKAIINYKQVGRNSWIMKDKEFCGDVKDFPNYKLIICGHWHRPYIYKYKNTKVINPGPMTRQSIDEWINPSVILIDTKTLIHKKVYLDTPDPEDVLSKKHTEHTIKSYTEGVLKFVDALKNKKLVTQKSFLKNLMALLDSHELEENLEEIFRDIISTALEKGALSK